MCSKWNYDSYPARDVESAAAGDAGNSYRG